MKDEDNQYLKEEFFQMKMYLELIASFLPESISCVQLKKSNQLIFDKSENILSKSTIAACLELSTPRGVISRPNDLSSLIQSTPQEIDSVCLYPLIADDVQVGTLALLNIQQDKLNEQQTSFLDTTASLIAHQIKNYEELVKHEHLRDTLSRVSNKMNDQQSFASRVNQSMAIIGKALNVSRVYVFEIFDNKSKGRNTFEWCAEGITQEIDNFQDFSFEILPGFLDSILENNGLIANSLDEIRPDLKEIVEPQGVTALTLHPMINSHGFFGLIGIDESKGERNWNKSEIDLLETVTQIFTNAFTEQRAHILLSETKQAHQNLYDHTPAMIHAVDEVGGLMDVNQFWLEKLGYTRNEVIGKNVFDFISMQSILDIENSVIPDFTRSGNAKNVPYTFVTKEGELVYTLLSAIPEYDQAGQFVRSVTIMTDITKVKAAEEVLISHNQELEAKVEERTAELRMLSEELIEQKALLQSIFDNTHLSIFVKDLEGRFQLVNKACSETIGLAVDDMIGKNGL